MEIQPINHFGQKRSVINAKLVEIETKPEHLDIVKLERRWAEFVRTADTLQRLIRKLGRPFWQFYGAVPNCFRRDVSASKRCEAGQSRGQHLEKESLRSNRDRVGAPG